MPVVVYWNRWSLALIRLSLSCSINVMTE